MALRFIIYFWTVFIGLVIPQQVGTPPRTEPVPTLVAKKKNYYATYEPTDKGFFSGYINAAGQAEGYFFQYGIDSALRAEGHYKQGKPQGFWKWFHTNGMLSSVEHWAANGLREGWSTHYHPTGKKSFEGNYKAGRKSGWWKKYLPDGKLSHEYLYTDTLDGYYSKWMLDDKLRAEGWVLEDPEGKLHKYGHWLYYDRQQAMESKMQYVRDTLHGYSWKYHPNGEVAEEGHFRNGLKEGFWRYFNPAGVVLSEGYFHQGKKELRWDAFDNMGVQISSVSFLHGIEHGYCRYYHNGKLQEEGNKVAGLRNGVWKVYLQSGQLKSVTNYD